MQFDLDALERSIQEDDYVHLDWTRCLAGHVFRVVNGRFATTVDEVWPVENGQTFQVAVDELSELLGVPGVTGLSRAVGTEARRNKHALPTAYDALAVVAKIRRNAEAREPVGAHA